MNYHPFNICAFYRGAPENVYKAAHCSQVPSQPEEYGHVPVSIVHAKDRDPSSSLNLCPQPEQLWKALPCRKAHFGKARFLEQAELTRDRLVQALRKGP